MINDRKYCLCKRKCCLDVVEYVSTTWWEKCHKIDGHEIGSKSTIYVYECT